MIIVVRFAAQCLRLQRGVRRKMYRKSRLDKYRAELVAMQQAGASCADLAEWLRVSHRCRMHRSSIDRYLRRLPELANEAAANKATFR